jgi:hypothetical protein
MRLQSKIIINISVGKAYANLQLDYETKSGVKRVDLTEYLDQLIIDTTHRMFAPQNLVLPLLIWAVYIPSDWRYYRNVQRFRATIQQIINERRAG